MLHLDGIKFTKNKIFVNDKFIKNKTDDILEQACYELNDRDVEFIAEDYLEVKEIAPSCMYELWYRQHHYSDVWSKTSDVFTQRLEANELYNKTIVSEEDAELYNESFNDTVYEIAELELLSKMKFFGVKYLNCDEEYMKQEGEDVWWDKFKHIEDTETRVWLIYIEKCHQDGFDGIWERVENDGHTLYKSGYGDIMEMNAEGNDYEVWGTVSRE